MPHLLPRQSAPPSPTPFNSTTLPFTCPQGGTFHACASSPSSFLGCCTSSNPCTTSCFQGNLRPVSFPSSLYGQFPDASCGRDSLFYTCLSSPPFWGCCKSNPCGGSGCKDGDLTAAFADNPAQQAWYFSGANSTTTPPTSTPTGPAETVTSTAEPNTTSTPPPPDDGSKEIHVGAIAGGAAAGGIILLLLIALVVYLLRSRWRNPKFSYPVGGCVPLAYRHDDSDAPGTMAQQYSAGEMEYPPTYTSPIPPFAQQKFHAYTTTTTSSSSPQNSPGSPSLSYELPGSPPPIDRGQEGTQAQRARHFSELSGDTAVRCELPETPGKEGKDGFGGVDEGGGGQRGSGRVRSPVVFEEIFAEEGEKGRVAGADRVI
ncbi:hypothetical protein BU24DRAFT_404791 [Aaosphaeria arxii CBS 175.79]|uniref:Uncharacterized protein n=1 Tax=Aaosphaeria arxii CBS 175.79 TaxID=1450172 RepID=A0A6A5Y8E1_9PLEO|nr:uncharacterized protein BU24DRAFT_404791 [Aaosphaeria arxii CBS 175.79]KAF2021835.1 hypothetical protein BU24DRAFT_404791 [Aaosphaeria arxii CBS 175.79]